MEYFNPDGSTNKYIDESRSTVRTRRNKYKNWSRMDHKPTTFGPTLLNNEDEDKFNNFDNNRAFTFNNFRLNDGNDIAMTLNFHLTSSELHHKGIN
jgi:hypothetical protein